MFDIIQIRTNVLNIFSEAYMKMIIENGKRHIILTAVTFIIMLSVLSAFFVIRAHAMSPAGEEEQVEYYKYTEMYRVCAGDTLNSIARMYMDDVHYDSEAEYVTELRKMNQMYFGDDLKTGELIAVCYYSTEYK